MTGQEFDVKFERAKFFIEGQISRNASYHQSKESMAYAGITLFGAIAVSATISNVWPPDWGNYTLPLTFLAFSLLWLAFLIFLRFQLTRRRWAALRVAGCERLLAAWIQGLPSDDDLNLDQIEKRKDPNIAVVFANFFWGSKDAVLAVKTHEAVYPKVLVKFWCDQEEKGTDALKHERLILICGWTFYAATIISTWLKICENVA